ncbi:MAG: hypothetical protein IH798_05230 [Gemmatimonadetes bacterium]|nr:hypothetical protein [Gemmatimonadota bacterium]
MHRAIEPQRASQPAGPRGGDRAGEPLPVDGVRGGRVWALAGAYVATQAAVFAARADDWWFTPTTSFHASWDRSANKEQDGLLHMAIAYEASQITAFAWDWACVNYTTAGWLGAATAVAINIPKEIGDGLHEERSFSLRDMTWAVTGAVLPALHRSVPASRNVVLKFGYWPSDEFQNRLPGALPQLENDYAGQRYYLVFAPGRYAGPPEQRWRSPIGIAVGHSIQSWILERPMHEWYLTLDAQFRGIPIRGETWQKIATVLDQIHFPLPGIRLRDGDVSFGFF